MNPRKRATGIIIAALVVIAFFLFAPRGDSYIIQGASMLPTYSVGTRLVVSRSVADVKRGQVIVFAYRAPNSFESQLVKRVVGLPGETLLFKSGKAYIDGIVIDISPISTQNISNSGPIKLGSDEYYVLGDNTSESIDSRLIGPVKKSDILRIVTGVRED